MPALRKGGTLDASEPADLRRAGYTVFGRDQYFVNTCGHGQEFITVPDTAGMWWLVPILGEAS